MNKRASGAAAMVLILGLSLGRVTGSDHAGDARIYRDEFGIPHVFAPTLEKALTRSVMRSQKIDWKSC